MTKPLELSQWDAGMGRNHQFIEAGAEMCARHVRQLIGKPDFESLAFDEMSKTKAILESALVKFNQAMAEYQAKDVVR
jgi:hypothetical protein